jgi:serine/threonine protein kinase
MLDRDVALVLIKTEGLDEDSKSRITREAQAMGRVGTHPNIVTVFDLGEENGQPFIVSEILGGGDVEVDRTQASDLKLSSPVRQHSTQGLDQVCGDVVRQFPIKRA